MDPVAIGVAVGMTVVSRLTKSLMEKAVDPTRVAKSVNWLFGAVSHFLKLRRKEEPKDTPIPAPPEATLQKAAPRESRHPFFGGQFAYVPKAQRYAQIYGLTGNRELERAYYDSARMDLEPMVEQQPEDARLRGALGIAYAKEGDREISGMDSRYSSRSMAAS